MRGQIEDAAARQNCLREPHLLEPDFCPEKPDTGPKSAAMSGLSGGSVRSIED